MWFVRLFKFQRLLHLLFNGRMVRVAERSNWPAIFADGQIPEFGGGGGRDADRLNPM